MASHLGFKKTRRLSTAQPVDDRLVKEVMISDETPESISDFCYLGDILSASGECELASIAHCKHA